jgi:hypothetical protein
MFGKFPICVNDAGGGILIVTKKEWKKRGVECAQARGLLLN